MKRNTNKLTYHYLAKIQESDRFHFGNCGLSKESNKTTFDQLKEIVSKERDYLLTDSFLDYTAFYGEYNLGQSLKGLCGDYYDIIESLMGYYGDIFFEYFCRVKGFYQSYANILDDEMKEIIDEISFRLKDIKKFYKIKSFKFEELEKIVCIILANYTLNHREGDIYQMCDIFLNDPVEILDSLKANNVCDEFNLSRKEAIKRLVDYINYRINNTDRKEIR